MEKQKLNGAVGLDLSLSCTGVAKVDWSRQSGPGGSAIPPGSFNKVDIFSIKTKPEEGTRLQRCIRIMRKISKVVGPSDLVLIEDYAYGAKPGRSSLATLGELNGIVKLAILHRTKREAITIAPQQWKKYLCGRGKLPKDAFKLEVFKRYKVEVPTNDEAVAYTLADMGGALAQNFPGRTRYEQEVLTKIRKTHSVLQKNIDKKISL